MSRAGYVAITRAELEEWLNSLRLDWDRVPSKKGVYLVKLSNLVGVSISSSVGSADSAMGRGQGAMHMRMVSLKTGRTLNRKATGQTRFNRTKNWRINWKKGLEAFRSVYRKSQAFYDKLATVKPEEYKEEWLETIEKIPGWDQNSFLQDLHSKVEGGSILSDKQEQAILRNRKTAPPQTPVVDEAYLQRLRNLYRQSKQRNDRRTLNFVTDIGLQLKGGKPLSPAQQSAIDEALRSYRLASRYLESKK